MTTAPTPSPKSKLKRLAMIGLPDACQLDIVCVSTTLLLGSALL
jgi:hypothetical protein